MNVAAGSPSSCGSSLITLRNCEKLQETEILLLKSLYSWLGMKDAERMLLCKFCAQFQNTRKVLFLQLGIITLFAAVLTLFLK